MGRVTTGRGCARLPSDARTLRRQLLWKRQQRVSESDLVTIPSSGFVLIAPTEGLCPAGRRAFQHSAHSVRSLCLWGTREGRGESCSQSSALTGVPGALPVVDMGDPPLGF